MSATGKRRFQRDTTDSGKLIKVIHTAKNALHLSDDDYRAVLRRITGKESSKAMSTAELEAVAAEFRRLGFKDRRPKAGGANEHLVAKLTALWWNLHHLGEAGRPSEQALLSFVHRQSKRYRPEAALPAALRFAGADDLSQAVDGAKQWCQRLGLHPADWDDFAAVNQTLIALLWQRLAEAGALTFKDEYHRDNALHQFLCKHYSSKNAVALHTIAGPDALDCVRRLSGWLARTRKKQAAAAEVMG